MECKLCSNIRFQQDENPGDYPDIEDGIYLNNDGHYYYFNNCEDYWYSGFVLRIIYCPHCGRKIDNND